MIEIGQRERLTQNRIVQLFRDKLHYAYLGNWEDHANNSNIEEVQLRNYLQKSGNNDALINIALDKLRSAAFNYEHSLYENNKEVHGLLRDGIRQSIVNQQKEFIQSFLSTIQFVFAGNDTEGLRYATIGTPDKYFLNWKEDITDTSQLQLDKYLLKLCDTKRFLELIYDFVWFDAGIKKLPRHLQVFWNKSRPGTCTQPRRRHHLAYTRSGGTKR